jgi:hypothetical protein
MPVTEVPELVPARMLNEYAYCPRLFFLEWVDQLWAPGRRVMGRRRYLVAYDIRDDRRLRSIAGCMEGYGTRIQYSVFVCDLSDREKIIMRGDIEGLMKQSGGQRDGDRSRPRWRLRPLPLPRSP